MGLNFAVVVLDGDVGSASSLWLVDKRLRLCSLSVSSGLTVEGSDISVGEVGCPLIASAPMARCMIEDVRTKYGTNDGVRLSVYN